MRFLPYRFATGSGDVIETVLTGNAANVRIMDDLNFQNYQTGKPYRFYGGHFTRSPAVITVPAGTWNVVVDLEGTTGGTVNAAVRVLQGAL
jgi:hypothetical protein